MFKALVLSKAADQVTAAIEQLDEARLPEGDVTVAVEASTLNYKDGLIIQNKAPLVRSYPACAGHRFRRARWSRAAIPSTERAMP